MASATTVRPAAEVTAQWLTDGVPFSLYTTMNGETGTDATGMPARTEASFGAWWIRMHGVTFAAGSTGKVLSHAGKVVTLGQPFGWAAVAKAEGGTTSVTPKLGALAVWGKSASIKNLNGDFSTGTATLASATTGHVGLVTGVYSNGDAQVSSWTDAGLTPSVVLGKETGLTYVSFATSASTAPFTLTVKNSTKADFAVSATPTAGSAASATVAHGDSWSASFSSYTNDLAPVSVTLFRAGKKVATYPATAGTTKVVVIK